MMTTLRPAAMRPLVRALASIPRKFITVKRTVNRMINTRTTIFPSTAPKEGSKNLLAMPSVNAPTNVPQRFPTPPNTTTMKLSMM